MDRSLWDSWWRTRGEDRLMILLWALWNPVGSWVCDEYSHYVRPIVSILEKRHERDAPLADRAQDPNIQRQRNANWANEVEELAAHLAHVRTTRMSVSARMDPSVERNAAEVLFDWYDWEMGRWEMDGLDRSS